MLQHHILAQFIWCFSHLDHFRTKDKLTPHSMSIIQRGHASRTCPPAISFKTKPHFILHLRGDNQLYCWSPVWLHKARRRREYTHTGCPWPCETLWTSRHSQEVLKKESSYACTTQLYNAGAERTYNTLTKRSAPEACLQRSTPLTFIILISYWIIFM